MEDDQLSKDDGDSCTYFGYYVERPGYSVAGGAFISLFLRKLKQPYLIAYILSGVLLGPEVSGLIEEEEVISQLGKLGVILLMFFIGAEIKLPELRRNFRLPLLGTASQLFLSILFISALGMYMSWSWKVIVLISFVISLSSSAIIFQFLAKNQQVNTPLGILTAGVLLIQDMLVVPMLLTLNFMGRGGLSVDEILLPSFGAALIILFLRAAIRRDLFRIPFKEDLVDDHELQVFVGFIICFGMAWITEAFGISAALGAFVAGILIGQDPSTKWLQHSLVPFRVFFLAFFFISVGLQLDLRFLAEHLGVICTIVLFILIINSLINALVFRALKVSWRDSVYAGALLSQVGEFSFVLSSTAFNLQLIGDYSYNIILSVIILTMVLTTGWIAVIRSLTFKAATSFLSYR